MGSNNNLRGKLKDLIKNQEFKSLEELIISTGENLILKELEKVIRVPDGATLADGLLSALQGVSRESLECRIKIFECVFEFARTESGSSSVTSDVLGALVGVLLRQVDVFPTHALLPFVDQFSELVKIGEPLQGRWVDLFPKLLSSLSERSDVCVGSREMTGEEYRYQVLKTLSVYEWPCETTTSLLLALKDLNLEKQELTDMVDKVKRVISGIEYQNVPPIVYQLVLTTQPKLPGVALKAVITYFNLQEKKLAAKEKKENDQAQNGTTSQSMDDISSAEHDQDNFVTERQVRDLREAQGTVILHLTHLAQFDPNVAKDYIKLVKSSTPLPHVLCSPFNLPLSLSLASIDRYQDQVQEAVRSCLLHSLVQEGRRQRNAWFRKTWPLTTDLLAVIRGTIVNCAGGWEQVSSGMCAVLLCLLEGGAGVKGEAAVLAVTTLPLLLTRHNRLAQHCIKHIANCTLTSTNTQHYVEVLSRLSRLCPLLLLEHHVLVREVVVEQLQHLQPSTATHVLIAVSNSLKIDVPLRDALIMALRKMLFSKSVEGRVVGVHGILLLLRQFRVVGALPSSQASLSFSSALSQISCTAQVHSDTPTSRNQALCYELLGIIRRCFSQQRQVRTALYRGLLDVCRTNPQLCPNILSLLHQHLAGYVDLRPDTLNPILAKKTMQCQGETVTLMEPLGELLSCLASCKLYYEKKRRDAENNSRLDGNDSDEDEDEENSITVLNDTCLLFDVLSEKLSTCDLDDLEFDSQAEFSVSAVGQKNTIAAQAIVATYDSVIEHTFYSEGLKLDDRFRKCIALFKIQRKIVNFIKTKSVKAPSKKGDGSKGKSRPASKISVNFDCILRLSVLADILSTAIGEEDLPEESTKILKDCFDFQLYLLTAVDSFVTNHKNLLPHEKDRQIPHFRKVARVLFVECFENFGRIDSDDEREVGRLRQCIGIVNSLFEIFAKYHKDKLEQILKEITNKSASKDLDALSFTVFKGCQKMLMKVLHLENNEPIMKDATMILQVMYKVSNFMTHDCEQIERAYEWVAQLAKDQVASHSQFCEELLRLLLCLSDQCKANHSYCHQIATDIYHCLGDNDQNVSAGDAVIVHAIINEDTVSGAITVLMVHLDDTLSLVEMSLNKQRAHLVTGTEHNANKVEENINVKLGGIIKTVNEIVRSALPLGPIMDLVIKKADKLYGILALFVRYYLDLFKMKLNPQISEKFEKLVHMSGELLSDPLYLFLNYIEDARSNGKGVALHTAMRESKLIPSLVFAIEKYEKLIIQLSNKSKVNLMTGMKLSTLRDFKIETDKLMHVEEEEDDQEAEEGVDEGGKTSKKRKKSKDAEESKQNTTKKRKTKAK